MKKMYRFISLLLLSGCLWGVFIPETAAQVAYGYEFKPKRKRVSIPFEWQCNLMIVKLRINKSDTLNFILDTGVGMNLLTDPKVATAMGLQYVKTIDIVGAGQGEALAAHVAIGNQIYLTGVRATGQSVVALSEDVLALSDYVGMPVHGVFGYDIFRSFVVEIDYSRKLVTLHNAKQYRYKTKKGEKIPVMIEDGKPYIVAEAILDNGKQIPLKLLVDTGAGHAISLDRNTKDGIEIPEKSMYVQLGRGLSGIITGHIGRLKNFKIGDYLLKDAITSFPDTNSLASRITRNSGRQGNVGCEILKRFHVTFNYNENYMILKPEKKFFKEPFERDMTGITIRARGENYDKYFIERVEGGSPAAKAGLEIGDEILSVNEKMSRNISLSDLYKIFQSKHGKPVKMFVKRRNEFFYTEFLLKKMI
ncbi:MAG: aspartyl protease family protein [Verrucomicrobia bacterium]|nr:aspartyl protease family protein [Cytophagales bacterium]